MKLYLMQHGQPVLKEKDPKKPLSDQGSDDVKIIAGFLRKSGVEINELIHSGKTRAKQTAELMISGLNPQARLKEKKGLTPLDDVNQIVDEINNREKNLMIIGHLPHLAKLVSRLVIRSESRPIVHFQQGGVVCLSRDKNSDWVITWMLVPALI